MASNGRTNMATSILIIQAHPDTSPHLCHALADAYQAGAEGAGHTVRRIDVTRLNFGFLRSRAEWETGQPADDIQQAQEDIRWATHLVFVYPLWLGSMPALLKAFLEQVARPPLISLDGKGPGLRGKSARIIVTMGMPAALYRWYFGAHSVKSFKRNILGFVGVKPIRETLLGLVEAGGAKRKQAWLKRMEVLGRAAI